MEQFNHKIFKLKKELTNITFDLNQFKTKNHRTISRIIDNLNTIQNKSKANTININNNNENNDIKYNINDSLNNIKKNIYYTKKSVSLEKNNLYPNKESKSNIDTISLSANNLYIDNNIINSNANPKRAISSYLNNDNKNKNCNKNNLIYDVLLDDINYDKILINKDKDKNNNICSYNKYYNILNIGFDTKKNLKQFNKYNTLDEKYFLDKENQNLISNYKNKKNKDNPVNIYSFNHKIVNNNNNNNKYNYNYNLTNIENEKNDLNFSKNYLKTKEKCKTLQKKEYLEPKIEVFNLNTIGFNKHHKINNNIINQHPLNLNKISQKRIKNDNLFKNNSKNNNMYNNQKINSFREKLLTTNKIKNYKYKNKIDDINNINNLDNSENNKSQVIKYLGANNIEEAKIKINKLMKCMTFYKKIENIYLQYNNKNRNYNSNDILQWILNICKYYSNYNYKSYLNTIMKAYHIDNLEQLKNFL